MEMEHPAQKVICSQQHMQYCSLIWTLPSSKKEDEDQLSNEAVQKEASTNNVLFWFP